MVKDIKRKGEEQQEQGKGRAEQTLDLRLGQSFITMKISKHIKMQDLAVRNRQKQYKGITELN